jgi:hypothetical protein
MAVAFPNLSETITSVNRYRIGFEATRSTLLIQWDLCKAVGKVGTQ